MKKLFLDFLEYIYSIFGRPGEVIPPGLTFDDVLLVPNYSGLTPDDVISTRVQLCRGIEINTPFIAAAMDTVTESAMAIIMARNGGVGIVHRGCSVETQCREVIHVKRHQSSMVTNPHTLLASQTVGDALKLYGEYGFGTFPIIDDNKKLIGLVTESRINNYSDHPEKLLSKIMVPFTELSIVYKGTSIDEAKEIMKEKDKKKLLVVASETDHTLIGIYFKKDIANISKYPNMAVDSKGRLLVGAAIGVGDDGYERAEALIKAGVDVLCIDTAQGDSSGVINIVKRLKKEYSHIPVIAGNVVTAEGAQRLIDAGADAVKVGVGPGAICTTREMTGNGFPQFSAIREVTKVTKKANIPLIADGGIKTPGDIVKALAAGADLVMMGSVFAGTDEAPGIIVEQGTARYKEYRGMGSEQAMKASLGVANDRYLVKPGVIKKVAEGVSGLVPYKGPVQDIIDKYLGALVQSMRVYRGAKNIKELQTNPKFIHQTQLGKIESGTRDLIFK
jgi:IMP dehydrogenase